MISHSIRFMKVLKEKGVPLQAYFHQGGHGGEPPFSMMNRWFTRYLFGVQNGVENDPKVWIVREGSDRLKPTPYADYPDPDSRPVQLFLTKGAPKEGGLVLARPTKQGKETIIDNYSFNGSILAQAEWCNNRLLFLLPPLKEPLRISGVPTITVRASSDKQAVNLSVWLIALPWTPDRSAKSTDNIIDRGWADLRNAKSITEGKPLSPGKFYDMTFELEPDDQIIPAGKQIALMIFSTDREFTLWPEPGTKLTIDLDATSITLPVVGGVEAIK
jgi:X-Pro dipeptidyl-peptidase